VGEIRLTDVATVRCTLEGSPSVALVGSQGQILPVKTWPWPEKFSSMLPRPATWPVLVLKPHGSAAARVASRNWCGGDVAALRISLPGGGTVDRSRNLQMGACNYPSDPSMFSVGAFMPPMRDHPKWPFVPQITRSSLHATPGARLHYVVEIIYPSRSGSTFSFPSPCPTYVEKLEQHGRAIAEARYMLNCGGIGPIAGGARVDFDMALHVPAGVTGQAKLVWVFDPPYGDPAKVPVKIH
jgi:hypothetical protein